MTQYEGNIRIQKAEQSCASAEKVVNEALLALGKKYFEDNRDNLSSEYSEQISEVAEAIKKEKLWRQYRLSLEGKMKCDKCGAIITSDSVFCNKCGTSIEPLDFSSINLDTPVAPVSSGFCQTCGATLIPGAIFCEKCGSKVC